MFSFSIVLSGSPTDIYVVDIVGYIALMLAAYYRAKDNVKGIIGQLWSDNWINEIEANNEGNTSLLLAAWFGRKYAVGQLYLETSK